MSGDHRLGAAGRAPMLRGFGRVPAPPIEGMVLAAALVLPFVVMTGYFWPPTNHDAAALLEVARRWIGGERLYRDVIDMNTPLVIALHALPELLASRFGGTDADWLVVMMIGATLVSTVLAARILPAATDEDQRALRLTLLLLVPFVIGVMVPDNGFLQRENIMVALALPYVFGAAARARGGHCGRWLRLTAGLLAGIGFAQKPYFLAIPFLIELYLLTRRPLRASFADIEPWAIAAVIVLHVLATLIFLPDYVNFVLPLSLELYTQLSSGPWTALHNSIIEMGVLALLAAAALSLRRGPPVVHVLIALGIGALISGLVQGKYWPYQIYPVLAAGLLALGGALAAHAGRWRSLLTGRGLRPAAVALAIVAAGYALMLAVSPPFEAQLAYHGSVAERLATVVRREKADRILVLSPAIAPIFSVFNECGARMAMPFLSMWPLQGLYAGCKPGQARYTPSDRMGKREREILTTVVDSFVKQKPPLLIADRSPGIPFCGTEFSFLDYFGRDPRFRAEFRHYKEITRIDRFTVYRREKG